MVNKIIQVVLIAVTLCMGNVLDMYSSYEKDDSLTIPEMIPIYVGPLYITGGAFEKYYLNKCEPMKLGEIQENNILLNVDKPNTFDTFSFKTIEYFKVINKSKTDTFYVMHMNSKKNNKDFEIVVELKDGPHYDRVIYLFENGKKYMMLYWLDEMNITKPNKSNQI